LGRWIFLLGVAALLAGCGSSSAAHGPDIERTFDVDWHDHATVQPIQYTARHIVFHDGRWSAEITLHNGTGKPLYPAPWSPADSNGFVWNGPALVYSGKDVLGERRLIYIPADTAKPEMPFPLARGATWRAKVGGKVPSKPALPKGDSIWLRYSVVYVGVPFAESTSNAEHVDWISVKAVQL
jgi:hypothetical protein